MTDDAVTAENPNNGRDNNNISFHDADSEV
jgi:hypothetical protein